MAETHFPLRGARQKKVKEGGQNACRGEGASVMGFVLQVRESTVGSMERLWCSSLVVHSGEISV
jgi:hypothetical protein